jgi:hypothetical protein
MDGDFGEDGYDDEYIEISVPTELVRRVVTAITDVMVEWEKEQREAGEKFSVLTGNAAMHIAMDYLDTIASVVDGETIQ